MKLQVGGQIFEVSEDFLVENSPYFKALLTGPYKERYDEVIKINRSATRFAQILDWLNGYITELTKDCSQELAFYGFGFEEEECVLDPELQVYEIEGLKEDSYIEDPHTTMSALLTLVAFGHANKIFHVKSEFPLFGVNKDLYSSACPHVSSQYFVQHFCGVVRFGHRTQADINRNGDAYSDISLLIELPALPSGSWWRHLAGYKIIKNIILEIGGWVMIRKTGSFFEAEYQLYGQKDEFVFDIPEEKRKVLSLQPVTLRVPLRLIRAKGNDIYKYFLPLVCSQFHQHRITIELNEVDSVIEGKPVNIEHIAASLAIKYYFLDNDDRRVMYENRVLIPINRPCTMYQEYYYNGNPLEVNLLQFATGLCKDFIIEVQYDGKKVDAIGELVFIANAIKYDFTAIFLKYEYPWKILGRTLPVGYYYLPFNEDPYYSYKGSFINLDRIDVAKFYLHMKQKGNYKITIHSTSMNTLQFQGNLCSLGFLS